MISAVRCSLMLPAIYHRYDATLANPDVEPSGQGQGRSAPFLDLAGGELDQLYSLARAATDLHDLGAGRWSTAARIGAVDRVADGLRRRGGRLSVAKFATLHWYTSGSAPSRRWTPPHDVSAGCSFRRRSSSHNVARTNEPERLNLWSTTRTDPEPAWSTPNSYR
jgi:hypothetical protein